MFGRRNLVIPNTVAAEIEWSILFVHCAAADDCDGAAAAKSRTNHLAEGVLGRKEGNGQVCLRAERFERGKGKANRNEAVLLSCKVRVALDRDDRVIESGRDRNHGPGAARAEHCTAHCTIRVTVTAFICSIYFLLSLAISLLLFFFFFFAYYSFTFIFSLLSVVPFSGLRE